MANRLAASIVGHTKKTSCDRGAIHGMNAYSEFDKVPGVRTVCTICRDSRGELVAPAECVGRVHLVCDEEYGAESSTIDTLRQIARVMLDHRELDAIHVQFANYVKVERAESSVEKFLLGLPVSGGEMEDRNHIVVALTQSDAKLLVFGVSHLGFVCRSVGCRTVH